MVIVIQHQLIGLFKKCPLCLNFNFVQRNDVMVSPIRLTSFLTTVFHKVCSDAFKVWWDI